MGPRHQNGWDGTFERQQMGPVHRHSGQHSILKQQRYSCLDTFQRNLVILDIQVADNLRTQLAISSFHPKHPAVVCKGCSRCRFR